MKTSHDIVEDIDFSPDALEIWNNAMLYPVSDMSYDSGMGRNIAIYRATTKRIIHKANVAAKYGIIKKYLINTIGGRKDRIKQKTDGTDMEKYEKIA